jgi:hypothetical protein
MIIRLPIFLFVLVFACGDAKKIWIVTSDQVIKKKKKRKKNMKFPSFSALADEYGACHSGAALQA